VKSLYEEKIRKGAAPLLEPGEQVVAAVIVRPRGWTQATAGAAGPGALAARMGAGKQVGNVEAAELAGFKLASPMALGVTQRRLLSIRIGSPIGLGIGGKVKELVAAIPVAEVDSIDVRRLAVGKTIMLTVRGVSFALEANAAADAQSVVAALERAKAGASVPG
jgi:hypothetical protein